MGASGLGAHSSPSPPMRVIDVRAVSPQATAFQGSQFGLKLDTWDLKALGNESGNLRSGQI